MNEWIIGIALKKEGYARRSQRRRLTAVQRTGVVVIIFSWFRDGDLDLHPLL